MTQSSKTITASNRDISTALTALETIVTGRGFPDSVTALRIGKTMRHLRIARDEAAEAQQILINNHAKRSDDGKIIPGVEANSVVLEDPREFLDESTNLAKETREVEIWPISITKLGTGDQQNKAKRCQRCKQLLGMPDPEPYATLVDLEILLEEEVE